METATSVGRIARTLRQVLVQLHDAAVLPQLGAVAPELHRRQHVHAQAVAGLLPLVCVGLRDSTRLHQHLLLNGDITL